MKYFVLVLFLSGFLFAQDSKNPHIIVDKQLDAYNNRDIIAFAKTYHDSVEVSNFPGDISIKGKMALVNKYEGMFNSLKKLHAKSLNRIILNNKVVDLEEASFYKTDLESPDKVVKVIVIYEIENNLIRRVQFSK